MAKGKKCPAELPEYGTVMMKGVQYYRTRITDADGKRVAIYGLTREELYDRVEDAQKKIAEVVFHRENPTVEEYCEKWLLMRSGTVRTNTLEGYARMVNRYIVGPIGQMYMDEVTTDDLRLLMVPLSKGSSGMYGQLNMLIKNIFNSAEESKVIKENPSKTICARGGKPAKRREALTDEQTAILLDSIRELPPYVFVMIGLYAGLRREEILGLKFKISPFSFFQTNTLGAEVLYKTARDFVGETKDKVIFDLYSGTGTIAQMLAPVAKKVVGVEIVEEAVEAAKVNAELNGLDNCEFIAGDVLKVVDELEDKPDFIVLDPPRDGIHPKAIQKIINFNVDQMVYISCKPTSLVRDLEVFEAAGYKVMRASAIDQFPSSVHIESIVLLQKVR